MRDLPPGWQTDLAVLEHTGSTVEDHGDHLVVRSPASPDYHWGNCLFVTDPAAVDEADRWLGVFAATFPDASWVAIALPRMPDNRAAWAAHRLGLELSDVLTTDTLPRRTPLAQGYTVRRLAGDDWADYVAREVAENNRTGEHDPVAHERFATQQVQAWRAMSEREVAAFFGAYAGDRLVADLGIVRCGTTARYQSVGTDLDHRRRGLASHLLGVAAAWAGEQGCDRWVTVTEATNPDGRVYRRLGFAPDVGSAQAYRPPAR